VALENAWRKAAAVAGGVGAATVAVGAATGAVGAAAGDAGAAAGEVGAAGGDRPVLGVDTLVSLGSRIYGKPRDAEHAAAMLSELAGRRHLVISGLCLISGGETRTAAAGTVVEFRALDAAAIASYVATGEWKGRAGAYAIQGRGATLVTRIEGDYLNVVGLPVAVLLELAPTLVGSW
jgi:septum formation protein